MTTRSGTVLLLLAAPLAGCASTPQVRNLADKTGVYVQSLDSGTSDFLMAQNRLNGLNTARLALLDQRSDLFRIEVRQQRFAWQDAGNNQRLASIDAVAARTPEMIVSDLHAKPLQPVEIKSTAAEGLGNTEKALADVATKPKPLAVLREFAEFAQAVHEDYAKLQKDAEQSTDDAATKAAATDKTALNSGAKSSSPQ